MSENSEREVNVEYCNKCGYLDKFQELVQHLENTHPLIKVEGKEGRRGSFEVSVNGELIHSKLSSLAFPDYEDLSKVLTEVNDGKPLRKCKEQPITSCVLS